MMTLNFVLLQSAQGAQGGGGMAFWIMIIAFIAIMYFFMIRPQKKRQKEIDNFRKGLQVGDEVITSGGVHGTIRQIDGGDNVVTLEIAKDVKIKVDRNCIFAKGSLDQQAK
jgi:preprotein translocase subunit YajC